MSPEYLKTLTPDELQAWQIQTARDNRRIFRIMAEFVEGFETMSIVGPCISIFGSARTKPGEEYYELGVETARAAVRKGFGVITGGGPGIMEAANKGAHLEKGASVGLSIDLPFEQKSNDFIDSDKLVDFNFFFVRKVMFIKYAKGFIVLPGGFGTLDELFESLTLIQTLKAKPFPVVLVGSSFWSGLVDWIKQTVLEAGNISEKDLDLFSVTDDPEEAVAIIDRHYQEHKKLMTNF